MKKVMIIFGAILFATTIITSCGGGGKSETKTKLNYSDEETTEANSQISVKPNIEHVVLKNDKPVISLSIENNSSYQIDFMDIEVSIYNEFDQKIINGTVNYVSMLYSNKIGPGDKANVTFDNISEPDSKSKRNLFDILNSKSENELQKYKVYIDNWRLFEASTSGQK